MKDKLVAVLILAVVAIVWRAVDRSGGVSDKQNPEVITNPVYLEMRINIGNDERTVEAVALMQTVNDGDCRKFSGKAMSMLDRQIAKTNQNVKVSLKSIECKTELSPRNARLFDNEPTFLTYVSAARGNRFEREMRWIYWGTSVEESEMVCGLVPNFQAHLKGKVSCIHARS